jgi:transcriptional regulator with XRE-family HTH domain
MQQRTRIGTVIKQLRLRADLSTQELGHRAGISGGTVSRIESGKTKTPSFEVLSKIAAALGCESVDAMLAGQSTERVQKRESAPKPTPEIDFVAASTTPGTDRLTIPPEAYEQLRALIQKIIDDAAAQKGYGVNTLPPHPTERRPSS